MWVAVWLALVVGDPASRTLFEGSKTFQTKDECRSYVDTYKARAPDYLRGMMNMPFDLEIEVYGGCKANGDPA